MRLHALVEDAAAAQIALEGGATVIQLRLKAGTTEVVVHGRAFAKLCRQHGATFVVNDDVGAAIELGADGVHLGRNDAGADRAREAGLMLGLSAAGVQQARQAESEGAIYIGAGPVWATPSKRDAEPPIGLGGLAAVAAAVAVPVVAIGGVDANNAGDCIRAGAAGVAVIRAAGDPALRAAVDAAL
ncbi:MAG: thiamine phosphate synthase [Gaiellaceae bacterium]